MLARRSASAQYDRDFGIGYIDAFVEHSRGDNSLVLAGFESLQDSFPFTRLRLMSDGGDEEYLRNSVSHLIGGGKDYRLICGVSAEDFFEHIEFCAGRGNNIAHFIPRLQSAPRSQISALLAYEQFQSPIVLVTGLQRFTRSPALLLFPSRSPVLIPIFLIYRFFAFVCAAFF